MSELSKKVVNIIGRINAEVADINDTERAMVMLYVMEIIKCSVDFDIASTFKPNGSPSKIVRCSDCIYHEPPSMKYGGGHVCNRLIVHGHIYVKPDGYCSWGERKKEVRDE